MFSISISLWDDRVQTTLAGARELWKQLKAKGCVVTYWQQGDRGWEKKA